MSRVCRRFCIVGAVVPAAGARRIGEFARRVGVRPELLRAWERRYGLVRPVRSAGGFRLYTETDAERVARMRRGLEQGLSAAEAARVALAAGPTAEALAAEPTAGPLVADAASRLMAAIRSYDEDAAHAVIDEFLAAFGLEPLLHELIAPMLRQLGHEWDQDKLGISREHFASNLIRGRLLSLSRLWGSGAGPSGLLACPPGEEHDLGLLMFGLLLHSRGWRVVFLGARHPNHHLGRDRGHDGAGVDRPGQLRSLAHRLRGESAPAPGAGSAAGPRWSRRGSRAGPPHRRPTPRPGPVPGGGRDCTLHPKRMT